MLLTYPEKHILYICLQLRRVGLHHDVIYTRKVTAKRAAPTWETTAQRSLWSSLYRLRSHCPCPTSHRRLHFTARQAWTERYL